MEDGSAGDFGEQLGGGGEPVRRGDAGGGVEAECVGEPAREVGDFDAVVDGAVGGPHDADVAVAGGGEVGGVAVEGLREVLGEYVSDAPRVPGDVLAAEEELEAGPHSWSAERGVSKPSTSEPLPRRAAE